MRNLYAPSTNIVDISALSNNSSLQTLSIYSNAINDLSPLATTNIKYLYLDYLPTVDLAELEGMPELVRLNLNGVTTLLNTPYFGSFPKLDNLSISYSNIDNFAFATYSRGLKTLYSYSVDLTGPGAMSGLEYLDGLETIALTSSSINDIQPLVTLAGAQVAPLNLVYLSAIDTIPCVQVDALESAMTGVLYRPVNCVTSVDVNPPQLGLIANQTSEEGEDISLQIVATDAEQGPVTFAASGLPGGLAMNRLTGRISGIVDVGTVGIYNVYLTASDGINIQSSSFTWTITLPPDPATPQNLQARKLASSSTYHLDWEEGNLQGVRYYEIETDASPPDIYQLHGATQTEETIINDAPGILQFRIRACNISDGCSAWSSYVPAAPDLEKVSNLQIVDLDELSGTFRLEWSYDQNVFNTPSGKPDHFEIRPTLLQSPEVILPADTLAGSSYPASGIWTMQELITLGDFIGSSFGIRACQVGGVCGPEQVTLIVGLQQPTDEPLPVPVWSTAGGQVSDDGDFGLSWSAAADGRVDYYEVTEVRESRQLVYYTENTHEEFSRHRSGLLTFSMRACERDRVNGDRCSDRSSEITVDVSIANNLPAPINGFFVQVGNSGFANLYWSYHASAFSDPRSAPDYFLINGGSDGMIRVDDEFRQLMWSTSRSVSNGRIYSIQACRSGGACGPALVITPSIFGATEAVASQTQESAPSGGPSDLKPGLWWNPDQIGTGWYFFWASDLRYPSIHESYGETYDLVAYWATYQYINGLWSPVWLVANLKERGGAFEGSLMYPNGELKPSIAGQVTINFDNREDGELPCPEAQQDNQCISATVFLNHVGMTADTADTRTIVLQDFAISNLPPGDPNIDDHYSGLWWPTSAQTDHPFVPADYAALTWIEQDLETMFVFFYDEDGIPVWVHGQSCIDVVDGNEVIQVCERTGKDAYSYDDAVNQNDQDRRFLTVREGFSPLYDAPIGYNLQDNLLTAGTGGRQFTDLNDGLFWFDIHLDGGEFGRNAELVTGGAGATERGASFHDIRYFIDDEIESATSCTTFFRGWCDVDLTWFTDDQYPGITAFYRKNGGPAQNLNLLCSESQPGGYVVKDFRCAITDGGTYLFELRKTSDPTEAPIAISASLLVTTDDPGLQSSPDPVDPPASIPSDQPTATSSSVGTLPGAFSVDGHGAATYRVSLQTVPGTGGLEPALGLVYSSRQGNGPLGMGWKIEGPSMIARCERTFVHDGAPASLQMSDEDRLCLDGQRLVNVSAFGYWDPNAEYRTEIDQLVRVTWEGVGAQAYPKVWYSDGSFATFGRLGNSRVMGHPGHPTTPITWAQDYFADSAGNFINYEYSHLHGGDPTLGDDGNAKMAVEFHLSQVTYTGHDENGDFDGDDQLPVGNPAEHTPFASVVFNYETSDRSDVETRYASGVEFRQTRLLDTIDSMNGGTWIRRYRISYDTDGVDRSIVDTIQECRDTTFAVCFPATDFQWTKSETAHQPNAPLTVELPPGGVQNVRAVDINGDGRQDLLFAQVVGGGDDLWFRYALAKSDGTEFDDPAGPDQGAGTTIAAVAFNEQSAVADYDLDGFQDVIFTDNTDVDGERNFRAFRWNNDQLTLEPVANLGPLPVDNLAGLNANKAARLQVLDVNGDGFSDLVYEASDLIVSMGVYVSLHQGPNAVPGQVFGTPISVDLPMMTAPTGYTMLETPSRTLTARVRPADVNGDGAGDFLASVFVRYCPTEDFVQPNTCTFTGNIRTHESWWAFVANGQGGFDQADMIQIAYAADCQIGCDGSLPFVEGEKIQLIDLNADGQSDLIYEDAGADLVLPDDNTWYYELNMTGFDFSMGLRNLIGPLNESQHLRVADIDGNGFADLLYPSPTSDRWRLIRWRNDGFEGIPAIDSELIAGDPEADGDASIFMDMNGDGRTDHLLIDRSDTAPFNVSTLYPGVDRDSQLLGYMPQNVVTQITNGLLADTWIEYGSMADPSVYTRAMDAGGFDACAVTVTGPRPYCDEVPVFDLIVPAYVVQRVGVDARSTDLGPLANMATTPSTQWTDYHYHGAKLQAGGGGSLGFRAISTFKMHNPSYAAGQGLRTTTRFEQRFPFVGLEGETYAEVLRAFATWYVDDGATDPLSPCLSSACLPSTFPGGLHRISYRANEWVAVNTSGAAVRPYTNQQFQVRYDLENPIETLLDQVLGQTDAIDGYANPTDITTTYRTAAGSLVLKEVVSNELDNRVDGSTWQIGLLLSTTIQSDRKGGICVTAEFTDPNEPNCVGRKVGYQYDARGLLQVHTREPDLPSLQLTTTYTLNSYGNPSGVSIVGDGVSRSGTVYYDDDGRFVDEQYNAYGQRMRYVLSRDEFGNPTQIADAVDKRTTISYDSMGRVFLTYDETGASSIINYELGSNPTGSASCPAGTHFSVRSDRAGEASRWLCVDAYSRVLRTIEPGFQPGELNSRDYEFDSLGRLARQSEPFTGPNPLNWNSTIYDEQSRVVFARNANAEDTIITYDQLLVGITDARGVVREETLNILGERIIVDEDVEDILATTIYSYDAVGNLRSVTDPDGVARTMSYNVRGHRTQINDPDMGGLWEYAHNGLGETVRQLSPALDASDFTYDNLGRTTLREDYGFLTSIDGNPTNPTRSVAWQYSIASNVVDPLTRESAFVPCFNGECQYARLISEDAIDQANFDRDFNYDGLGRVSEVITASAPPTDLDGDNTPRVFSQELTYDEFGRVFQAFDAAADNLYPGGGQRYVYNSQGYLESLREAANPNGSVRTYATVTAANARGQITHITHGNGLITEFGHDVLGRVESIDTPGLQSWSVGYDAVGNVDYRHDELMDLREDFQYDGLNRLQQIDLTSQRLFAHSSPVPTTGLNYSPGGSLLCRDTVSRCNSGVVNHSYGDFGAPPHAITGLLAPETAEQYDYDYDAKGNQTAKRAAGSQVVERQVDYSVANLPEVISSDNGATITRFFYDPGGSRYLREDYEGGQVTRTFYVGSVELVVDHNSGRFYRRNMGGVAVAVYTDLGNERVRYLLKDHLGSIDAITDEQGGLTQRLSFDAFAQRRLPDDWQFYSPNQFIAVNRDTQTVTQDGYTGHEQLDSFNMIHMNGRVYDPQTSQFMQADPFVPNPGLGQSFNRYSYVLNNPLSLTDPSGYAPNGVVAKGLNGSTCQICVGTGGGVSSPFVGVGPFEPLNGYYRTLLGVGSVDTETLPGVGQVQFGGHGISGTSEFSKDSELEIIQDFSIMGNPILLQEIYSKAEEIEESLRIAPARAALLTAHEGKSVALGGNPNPPDEFSNDINLFGGDNVLRLNFNSRGGELIGASVLNRGIEENTPELFVGPAVQVLRAGSIIMQTQVTRVILYRITTREAALVDAQGLNALTRAQANAARNNSYLWPMFRGFTIDKRARAAIRGFPVLRVRLFGKPNKGVDFTDRVTGARFDITTPGQAAAHYEKYGNDIYLIFTR